MKVVNYTGIVQQVIVAINDAEANNTPIYYIELNDEEMGEFLKHEEFKRGEGVDLTGQVTNIKPAKHRTDPTKDTDWLPTEFRFRNVLIRRQKNQA